MRCHGGLPYSGQSRSDSETAAGKRGRLDMAIKRCVNGRMKRIRSAFLIHDNRKAKKKKNKVVLQIFFFFWHYSFIVEQRNRW